LVLLVLTINMFAKKIVLNKDTNQGYTITNNSSSFLELEFDVNSIFTTNFKNETDNFTELSITNGFLTRDIGSPALPTFRNLIEVAIKGSPEVKVLSFDVKEYSLSELGIENIIAPVQPSYSKSIDPSEIKFEYNKNAYMIDGFDKNDIASISKSGNSRGSGIASLVVSPFKYNPVKGILKVYTNIKLQIDFNGVISESAKRREYSPAFEKSFSSLINYNEISSKDDLTRDPITYLILANDQLSGNTKLDEFISWKTDKGFNVLVSYVSASSSIATNDTWIESQYSSISPAPSFLLIVGDEDGTYAVKTEISPPLGSGGTVSVSDLLYGVIGETSSSNRIPSIYVGRFSVRSELELTAQVDKTIWYEKTQFTSSSDLSYLGNVLGVAGVDGNYAPTHGNPQIRYGGEYYFNHTFEDSVTNQPVDINYISYLDPNNSGISSTVISHVSDGLAFYNYTAHGSNSSFADPQFTISQINSLGNANEYPLVVGNCCLTGSFGDPECFGESWLNVADRGAIGFIGASMSTYWDEDLSMGVGLAASGNSTPAHSPDDPGMYDGTMNMDYPTQAGTKHVGLLAVETLGTDMTSSYWSSYHLFGDPSLMVYYGVPTDLSVSHNTTISPGETSFTVNTRAYAYVALTDDDGVLHGVARANSSGVAEVTMTSFNSGNAYLVITAQFAKPHFATIAIETATGPYVTVETITAHNNEYGALCTVDITLENTGVEISPNASISATTSSIFATIVDGTETFGNIAINGTVTRNNAISLNISNLVPDQEVIRVDVVITDSYSKSTYNSYFNIIANAPYLEYNYTLAPAGSINPGDTRSFDFTVTNNGHSDASGISADLSVSGINAVITETTSIGNSLAIGSSSHVVYDVYIDIATPTGSTAAFDLNILGDKNVNDHYIFSETIGVFEDFETGDFTKNPWTFSGDADWIISTNSPYEGSFSAASADISDNENSSLEISVEFFGAGSISFYKKVSSETNFDFLKFYIDGSVQGEWSGDGSWSNESYDVSAGVHNLKWEFDKDSYVSSNDDCGYVDYIMINRGASQIDEDIIPKVTTLYQNYPNPFNPETTIKYYLVNDANVNLVVFNAKGEQVYNSSVKDVVTGKHSITFDGSSFNSGVYFYNLIVDGKNIQTKKMLLVK